MPAEPRTDSRTDASTEAQLASGADTLAGLLECIDCPVCGRARPAEHPIGNDAGDDERLCVDCGAAVFVDPMVPVRAVAA